MINKVLTLVTDISDWNPNQSEWNHLINLFSDDCQRKIKSYSQLIDSKRCLIGKLLVHTLVCKNYGLRWDQVRFNLTPEGRPYLLNTLEEGMCKFDFNISHDSNLVVVSFIEQSALKTEDSNISRIGTDVMRVSLPRGETSINGFYELLSDYLTETELQSLGPFFHSESSFSTNNLSLSRLIRIWTLKESVIKAIGLGLLIDLKTLSFNSLDSCYNNQQKNIIETCEFSSSKELYELCEPDFTVRGVKRWEDWVFWIASIKAGDGFNYSLSVAVNLASGLDRESLREVEHNLEVVSIQKLLDKLPFKT
ncbi:expressed protein [Phakopsora pachyrhizi]|uniref:holo-[acyl-carrier-protein] synthase n=1 Tax=Phakopsora pachyrhizi TaxID=170000 RepID=A0AAV0AN31_PHAPC|nr:expressed protein [Phakopsora pachyrhizi]CAH7682333.1 expressed protein [Phakopsora pachyrhizi]